MRCSEPGHQAPVAIMAARWTGRRAGVVESKNANSMPCDICGKYDKQMTHTNWSLIFDQLLSDLREKRVSHLDGDCPLEETINHISNETKFAIIQNFLCTCGTRIEWGVCIRGEPLLRLHVP